LFLLLVLLSDSGTCIAAAGINTNRLPAAGACKQLDQQPAGTECPACLIQLNLLQRVVFQLL
jgi:hypothetical protein